MRGHALAVLSFVIFTLCAPASIHAQAADCNPYANACPTTPGGEPFPDPYHLPQTGPYVGLGPYAPPTRLLESAMQTWVINGDVFLDEGARRYGWLILDNLGKDRQQAIIEYTSEAWALPAYHVVTLEARQRSVVSLHEEVVLQGMHVSARVYFLGAPGALYATFRPHAGDATGQFDVQGQPIPTTCGTRE